MTLRVAIIAACAVLALWPGAAEAQTPPAAVEKNIVAAIAQGRQAQAETDAWLAERAALLAEISDQRRRNLWTAYRIEKHRDYLKKQAETMGALAERQRENERIRMELAPYLDELLERLTAAVESDLPFLMEERRKRLSFLKESLSDYHLSLADKAARLFEALRIEAAYGKDLEVSEAVIQLAGVPVKASLLRLGRAALFHRTPDGGRIGRYDRETGAWTPLLPRFDRDLRQAMAVVAKKEAPELLTLPVGKALP